jgi:hypothetical protein
METKQWVGVEKIVSAGQTGGDRGGLTAAWGLGIPCGGWCPKGRRAEDAGIPQKYPMQETASEEYRRKAIEARIQTIDTRLRHG